MIQNVPNLLSPYHGVFFDLDGTLADTAPDLVAATNKLLLARKLAPKPYAELRPCASAGARGLIGGAFGVTENVRKRANQCWSLSNLVFPHQLVRLIVAEQVYRTFSILNNSPYHHV